MENKWNNDTKTLVKFSRSNMINTIQKNKINDVEDMDLYNRHYYYNNKYELGDNKYRDYYGKK